MLQALLTIILPCQMGMEDVIQGQRDPLYIFRKVSTSKVERIPLSDSE